MIKASSKKVFFTWFASGLLLLLYIFSFTLFSDDKDKKAFRTQLILINEADISNIDGFVVQDSKGALLISKTKDMWLLASAEDSLNTIPADTQKLKEFFLLLTSKKELTKAGEKKSDQELNSYGLSSSQAITISIYKNGSRYKTLSFGDLNFSQTGRYFTDEELNSILLYDNSFDSYLTSSLQNWADPYIISDQLKNYVFNCGDIQSASSYDYIQKEGKVLTSQDENWQSSISKLEELRHGGFAKDAEKLISQNSLSPVIKVHLETGNMASILLEIYATPNESQFIVKSSFNSEPQAKSFSYYTSISLWTYNKIKEIML